jgi:N-acetylmuramoyl-L-alanine amidase
VLNIVSSHHVGSKLVPLGSSPSTFAKETIVRSQLVLNNHVVLLNQPMQDKSNMLFAPFRQIFENEGGVMSWNSVSHQVHAQNGSRDIEVTIGSKSATVNQQQVTLSATPYIVSGHTMIPLAFVPMALNATVNYDPATGHIVINSKD